MSGPSSIILAHVKPEEIAALYNAGMSQQQIAEKYDTEQPVIHRFMVRHNIPRRKVKGGRRK